MNISKVVENIEGLLKQADMIGIGSTRKVYRFEDIVIKTFLHSIGYAQSKNEDQMYKSLEMQGLEKHIAPILFLSEKYVVQPFYEQLPLHNHCSYDIDLENDPRMLEDLKTAIEVIDQELDGFDFKDSGNYGLNEEGYLVLIDYGMTKKLYEEQWVPLAEAGTLPQIRFEKCRVCNIEKELRMYGEKDTDNRCMTCGKDY
ncbi:protein kinase [Solibacillus isronensis]|uniref:protein kinase n=1 Tax=Solibacillus isronensis TaxID=412383 RepID=UPI0020422B74|nr:protein kinase [Solibacillus isronensis]MCM3721202.1 protein kinase [Solibacillus isronensis]